MGEMLFVVSDLRYEYINQTILLIHDEDADKYNDDSDNFI